ncbi:DUF2975 domain-containing protein [Nonomuraea sp. NEAU-A123]|uniref:DUF2975 domain-containing protein n=1 Tax=Nonomuraea sp. NEAU-A123 TaxID=2839649 RepID=UPI001BE4A572|nr:DUF2975 domain-containing protein [Nonomuraea sp. NEAU-A123]MBT2229430.1 DUF2975 domain-containing protein [Nonomuraea sp. NEAU-A123]
MSLNRSTPMKWTAITVRVLLVLFAGMMIYTVGGTALTGGENAYYAHGEAHSLVCALAPGITAVEGNFLENPQRQKPAPTRSVYDDAYPVKKGVEFQTGPPEICKDDSTLGTQLLYQTSRFATPFMLLIALFLLERLIRDARRENGFDEVIVRRLWFLGVFLAVSTLAASIYTTIVETGLAVSMVDSTVRSPWNMALFGWVVPWAYLVAGLGLVVMSKVVRAGAHMREELEGTV